MASPMGEGVHSKWRQVDTIGKAFMRGYESIQVGGFYPPDYPNRACDLNMLYLYAR